MSTLYLVCGIPGSGKTTWIKEHLQKNEAWISRDMIRFPLIDDEYFTHEKEVFRRYCDAINQALYSFDAVYADATQINETSRNKLLNNLDLKQVKIKVICFETPLDVCLARNEKRIGLEKVPRNVILKMYNQYQRPTNDEKYKYDSIEVIK